MNDVEIIVLFLFAITFLALVSYRFRFPFPIVLVIAGLIISLIPGLPVITLNPEVVFLIFLPPLLYGAAWNTSWHEFRANLRPITLASIGLVFLTTLCVAAAVHYLIPGFSWPLSFLLGAIISPPDAVAASAITKGLGIHPRILTILEGESLVNDASALVAYRYALSTIAVGSFSIREAGINFMLIFLGGIAVGLIISFFIYLLHKNWVKDAAIDVTLTFLTPFAAYLIAEQFHLSGVLAVVTSGLYLSFRSGEIFTNQSRMEAYAVWEVVTFVLNALVFILIGLQLRNIVSEFHGHQLWRLAGFGAIIGLVALLVRFVWTIPAAYVPRMLSKRIRETEYFDSRLLVVFILGGMRGIVSMAAALSIPVMAGNEKFPYRAEIIFLTFCVILFTLLVQGLPLPWIVRAMKLPRHSVLAEEYNVRKELMDITTKYIEEEFSEISEELKTMLTTKYKTRYGMLEQSRLPGGKKKNRNNPATAIFNQFGDLQLELLQLERQVAYRLRKEGKASEPVLRKIEREIDLEETRLRLELYTD